MWLNTAETCTDSNGASEASTSEAIEHFVYANTLEHVDEVIQQTTET